MGYAYYTLPDGREAGYSVDAECDHPDCHEQIDRGLGYLCGRNPDGWRDDEDPGCGKYFCESHKYDHDCDNPECGLFPADLMESWRSWMSDKVALEPAEQLPDDWPQFPQFPRERWAILPAARARALMLAERCIDLGELGYAGWLLQYGGKVRLS